jgi:Transposase DDE domain
MRRHRPSPDSTLATGVEPCAVWPEKVIGRKYVRLLEKLLRELRDGSEHGNRRLFLDDVFVAHLLAFFNPAIRSLRAIEDFSQTVQARRHLSTTRVCRSTLSDFHRLVDPTRLRPVLDALRSQVERKQASQPRSDSDLARLLRRTVAVDGTFLPACAEVVWAIRCASQRADHRYRARLDFKVHVDTVLPEVVVIPESKESESDAAIPLVQPGQISLYDRGYNSFALINAHYREINAAQAAVAHFIIRYRPAGKNASTLVEVSDRELSPSDRAAGVVSDRVGCFRSSKRARHRILDVPLREVIVERIDGGKVTTLRLMTNLLDVPAAIVAELYRYRWQIELFFRWLKCFGNFAHLVSHSSAGVLVQFYVAVIAAMLMYLHTGYRPSKYLFTLLSQVAAGAATIEEVLPILRERERQCELARRSAQNRRAKRRA